jgi:propanol-preferring alcohol dehydrogenase
MKAMVLARRASGRVEPLDVPIPEPGPGQILLKVLACGVCRTDLHLVDGELPDPTIPVVPGHEIVGRVERVGAAAAFAAGERVGVPWLGLTCGACEYCVSDRENLCRGARYTGYQIDGGYAEYAVAEARYCVRLPSMYDDSHAAPLLCAGLIGHRAYRMGGNGHRVGIYGFGAAAHVIAQVALHEGREVYAFVRPGDERAIGFAREMGVTWVGTSEQSPPAPLDAALIFAPVGALVPVGLSHVAPGGVVVCAGIHMSEIPAFPYRLLWEERVVRSVANLTRADARTFMGVAEEVPIKTRVRTYALAEANEALADLRSGALSGAAVLVP